MGNVREFKRGGQMTADITRAMALIYKIARKKSADEMISHYVDLIAGGFLRLEDPPHQNTLSNWMNDDSLTPVLSASSPDSVVFASTAAGLTMANPAYKWTFVVKTDGSKVPLTGPTVPAHAYVVSTADGPSTLKIAYFIGGTSFGNNTLTVRADGKSMAWVSQAPGAAVTTSVYEKQ